MEGNAVTAAPLVKAVHDAGGHLAIEDGKLKVSAPAPLPDALVGELRAHKTELLDFLATGRAGHGSGLDRAEAPATDDGMDWHHYFEERATIAEHDGGLSRQDAEARAWECAIVRWMNTNPPPKSDPDKCAGCGEPAGHIGTDAVPVLTGRGRHVWVHHTCHQRLMARRRAEAIEALTTIGLINPRLKRKRSGDK